MAAGFSQGALAFAFLLRVAVPQICLFGETNQWKSFPSCNAKAAVQGKAALEANQDALRKKEKGRDGALTWETALPLEIPEVSKILSQAHQ